MKKNKTQNKVQSAFTLIELLVVATIIILLATMGLVSYRTAVKNSKVAKCESDLQAIRQALVMYRSEEGNYPATQPVANLISGPLSDYISSSDDFDHPVSGLNYEYIGGTSFTLTAPSCIDSDITVTSP